MEQGASLLAPGRGKDGVRRVMRRRRTARHGRPPSGVEGLDGIADGLIVAVQALGNEPGVLALGTGQENLDRRSIKALAERKPWWRACCSDSVTARIYRGFLMSHSIPHFLKTLLEIALG
jgi:hypothetical protein